MAVGLWIHALASASLLGQASAGLLPPEPRFSYGPHEARPAMHYFKHWSGGAVSQKVGKDKTTAAHSSWGFFSSLWSDEPYSALIHKHRAAVCSASEEPLVLELHSAEVDPDEVHHVVFHSQAGHFQYAALRRGEVLVMDPPPCKRTPTPGLQAARQLSYEQDHPYGNGIRVPSGEPEELLHPSQDPLVLDCVQLFERTARENCHENVATQVLAASLTVLDGFEVRMHVAAQRHAGLDDAPTVHHLVYCAFEFPREGQAPDTSEPEEMKTDEEKHGLIGTVIMQTDLCKALFEEWQPSEERLLLEVFNTHRMGELSLLKGYRHVYDEVPRFFGELQNKEEVTENAVPETHSLREVAPQCFPNGGREVVRDQGTCGSCWAFAAASAIMANLCVIGAGNHSFLTDKQEDRYEVSIQRIISCNGYEYGCDGGHALSAAESFETARMAKDRDVQYACGGGNSLNHFHSSETKCAKFPWGGSAETCDPKAVETKWNFQRLYSVSGEEEMMKVMYLGNALYLTIKVYKNLLYHRRGVYDALKGPAVGGHAVTGLGYGVEGGKKYWEIQNSWGPRWAERGFGKILRGENLAKIEDVAMYFRAYPEGTTPPPLPTDGFLTERGLLIVCAVMVTVASLAVYSFKSRIQQVKQQVLMLRHDDESDLDMKN